MKTIAMLVLVTEKMSGRANKSLGMHAERGAATAIAVLAFEC